MTNNLSPSHSIRGLSDAEAQFRLKTEGYNELPQPERRTSLRIALEVLSEPMMALLLSGGVIYFAIGEPSDAFILLAFATLSVLITVIEEARTERVLEALRDLTSPRALVVRGGERKRIAGLFSFHADQRQAPELACSGRALVVVARALGTVGDGLPRGVLGLLAYSSTSPQGRHLRAVDVRFRSGAPSAWEPSPSLAGGRVVPLTIWCRRALVTH